MALSPCSYIVAQNPLFVQFIIPRHVQKSRIMHQKNAVDKKGLSRCINPVQNHPMTIPPIRTQIIAALQDPKANAIADRVAEAVTAYGRALEEEANRRGSLDNIRLPAPTNEIESVALELFMDEIRTSMPGVAIKIKGDS